MCFFLLLCLVAILAAANTFLLLFAKADVTTAAKELDIDQRVLRAGSGGSTYSPVEKAGAYFSYFDAIFTVFRSVLHRSPQPDLCSSCSSG